MESEKKKEEGIRNRNQTAIPSRWKPKAVGIQIEGSLTCRMHIKEKRYQKQMQDDEK